MIILSKCEQTKRKQKREIKRAHTKPINNDNGKPNREIHYTIHNTETQKETHEGLLRIVYNSKPTRIRMKHDICTYISWDTKCV